MRVIRTLLPKKSNLPMAQAAATPKRRFAGTAMPAAIRVSRIAAQASGSRKLARYAAKPFAKAELKTTANGKNRKTPRNSTAIPVSSQRTHGPSVVAVVVLGATAAGFLNVTVVAILSFLV